MIRHAGRAVALFAVGALFASGAWAAAPTLAQTVYEPYLVAEELLGSADGSVVKLGSAGGSNAAERPLVRLTVPEGIIVAGNAAELTFTLTGAVFGQGVGASLLDLHDGEGESVEGLSTEVTLGGAIGDDFVKFLIEATGDGIASGAGDGGERAIVFKVPDLKVTPVIVGYVSGGTVAVKGAGIVASMKEKRAVTSVEGGFPFPMVSGAEVTLTVDNYMNRQVVRLGDVVSINLGESDTNVAAVALNKREVFKSSNATYKAPGAQATVNALQVGLLTITINGGADDDPIYTLDPSDPAVDVNGLDNSLGGNVEVEVRGAFKTGDMVVYGSPGKEAKMAGGMASISIPIAAGTTDIKYVPGGVEPLRPTGRTPITAMATLNFSRAGNASGKSATSKGTITYDGVDVHAYAHGVVKAGGTDVSFLRIRCVNATDCAVFLDCNDQDGNNYFDELGTVGVGKTKAFDSDDVAGALPGGVGWSSGRGACDLMSNGSLEVQHMVRSGNTLINNSAVVGRSLDGG